MRSDYRVGFSVILLESAIRGIELGFWTSPGRIWAQSGPPFNKPRALPSRPMPKSSTTRWTCNVTRTPSVPTGHWADLVDARLPSFGAPYNIKNFISFGDDTMSARASVDLVTIGISGYRSRAEQQ